MRKKIAAGIMGVSLGGFLAACQAGFALLDNFESYSTGGLAAQSVNWSVGGTGGDANATVASAAGNNYLDKGGAAGTGAFFNNGSTLIAQGDVGTYFFRAYMPAGTGVGAAMLSLPAGGWNDARPLVRWGGGDTTIAAYDGSIPDYVELTAASDGGAWYNTWVVVDNTANRSYDVYIQSDDDADFATQTQIGDDLVFRAAGNDALQTILFLSGGNAAGVGARFDDLYIDPTTHNLDLPPVQETTAVIETHIYPSTISSDSNGPLDLVAELNYNASVSNAPIAVVMHGYSGTEGLLDKVRSGAQHLRDKGFFAISVAMRNRDGSDGIRDSGGLEIYDIYDAVESVKATYSALINPDIVYIIGTSGGGGNTMSALGKFPDYFNAGAAFFGMSDYGYDPTNSWYFEGAYATHKTQLRTDVGDPTLGNTNITDRYHARASNRASANNPYSEIHLFVNDDEVICPPIHSITFVSNAVSHEAYAGEFSNMTLHIGQPWLYEDFNTNGFYEADEQQYWPHGYPPAERQDAAENWFMDRLLAGAIPRPVLNATDTLFVAGFVKTARFECRVGDGQEGMIRLDYALTSTNMTFQSTVLSLNKERLSRLMVDTAVFSNQVVEVFLNATRVDSFVGGGTWTTDTLKDGDSLELRVAGLSPSLLAYYDFEYGLNDQTTNGFHGVSTTIGGAGVVFTNTVPTRLEGTSRAAAVFDGASWVRLSFLNLYGLAQSAGITISFWVKGGSTSSWVLSEGSNTNDNPAYCFGPRADADTWYTFIRTDTAVKLQDGVSSGSVFDGTWHHVAWTDQAGTAKLYIDGASADAADFSYQPGTLTMNTTTIGALERLPDSPKYPFSGCIDDLSVWTEVLSSNSIASLGAGASPLELAGLLTDPSQPVVFKDMHFLSPTNLSLSFIGPTMAVQPRVWYTTNLLEEWAPVSTLTDVLKTNGVFIRAFDIPSMDPVAFFRVIY